MAKIAKFNKQMTFAMTMSDYEKLRRLSDKRMVSFAELLREIVEEYLKQNPVAGKENK